MTVVHYLNQFFAGLGGEEAAGHEPVRIEGAVGPGRGLVGAGLEIDVTLACGDDRFGEHEEESLAAAARVARRDPARRPGVRPFVRLRTVRLRVRRRSRARPDGAASRSSPA